MNQDFWFFVAAVLLLLSAIIGIVLYTWLGYQNGLFGRPFRRPYFIVWGNSCAAIAMLLVVVGTLSFVGAVLFYINHIEISDDWMDVLADWGILGTFMGLISWIFLVTSYLFLLLEQHTGRFNIRVKSA